MQYLLLTWSRLAFLAGLVLALVLVVPVAWVPFMVTKLALFALLLIPAAILFVLGRGTTDVVRSPGFVGALSVAALPLIYLVSLLVSTDRSVGLGGYTLEADTVLFATLAFLAFFISFALFRTQRTVRQLLWVLSAALAAAVVFQWVSIVFGSSAIPLATFADRTANLIGKWNDLGLLAGLLILLLAVRLELAPPARLWRWLSYAGLALLGLLLLFVNFPVVWSFLLTATLVLVIFKFLSLRRAEEHHGSRVPWVSLTVAALAALMLLFGGAVNGWLTSTLAARNITVTSLEVRPAYQTTLGVIAAARQGSVTRALVGTGPNTFGEQWLMHKPAEVNQTQFWNLDFNVGYSTLLTAFGSVGLLGVLAWLVPLVLVLVGLLRVMRLGALSREDRFLAACLAFASIFMLGTLVFYAPSPNLIVLALVLAGAAYGFFTRQGGAHTDTHMSRIALMGTAALAGILILGSLVVGGESVRRFASELYVGKGAYALSEQKIDDARTYAARATAFEESGNTQRLSIEAAGAKLQQIVGDKEIKPADAQAQFTATVGEATAAGQRAVLAYPKDYRPHFVLGQLYTFLASLKIDQAYEAAKAEYKAAADLSPMNPEIPLSLARLEAGQGNAQATADALAGALKLKQNYTDAILFLMQLNIAQNDIPSATKAAEAAVQSAPGVPALWFQLGLLYYAGGNTDGAVQALEQAVTFVPDYANAKYYLGLAYYKQGKTADAQKQFEDIAQTNPDNAEVRTIISNLKLGKEPLDGISQGAPEDRTTAPVAE